MTSDSKPRLTALQEAFALNVVQGMKLCDAYVAAGYSPGREPNTVYSLSSALAAEPKIAQRIRELTDAVAAPRILDVSQRCELLTKFALSEDVETRDRNVAIDLLNKTTNTYKSRLEVTIDIGPELAAQIAQASQLALQHESKRLGAIEGQYKELPAPG